MSKDFAFSIVFPMLAVLLIAICTAVGWASRSLC